jgi:hypothetical protein
VLTTDLTVRVSMLNGMSSAPPKARDTASRVGALPPDRRSAEWWCGIASRLHSCSWEYCAVGRGRTCDGNHAGGAVAKRQVLHYLQGAAPGPIR